jgi:hypothetical protein
MPMVSLPPHNSLSSPPSLILPPSGASTAEADLAVFSSSFGLPQATTANGLFLKVNQTGGTDYPADDLTSKYVFVFSPFFLSSNLVNSWALEVGLDIQSAHAFAPGARLLLIVCNSDSFNDLMTGVELARANAGILLLFLYCFYFILFFFLMKQILRFHELGSPRGNLHPLLRTHLRWNRRLFLRLHW